MFFYIKNKRLKGTFQKKITKKKFKKSLAKNIDNQNGSFAEDERSKVESICARVYEYPGCTYLLQKKNIVNPSNIEL